MPPVTFIGSLCKIHVVLCLKIADIHEIEVHDVRNLFIFGHFSDFCCITPEVSRGGKGAQFHGVRITVGGQKVATMSKALFFKTVHLLPKNLRFEHVGTKLVSFPRRHLTSLRPCTSRLSSQNGEICLQKYLHISGKLSITNYLTQNAVDCIEVI